MVRIESTHVKLHVVSFDGVETIILVGQRACLAFEERENLPRAHRGTRFLEEKDELAII